MDINNLRDRLVNLYYKATDEKVKNYLLYKLQQLESSKKSPSLFNYMSDNPTTANRLSLDSGVIYPNDDLPITQMRMFEPNTEKTYDEHIKINNPSPYTKFRL